VLFVLVYILILISTPPSSWLFFERSLGSI